MSRPRMGYGHTSVLVHVGHHCAPAVQRLGCSTAPLAGLADALLAAAFAAVVRRAGEPEIATDLAAIVERAIEHLVDQLLPADRTDALEVDELHHLGLGRTGCGGTQRGFVRRFKRAQLPGDKAQPLVLAHDLLLEPWR